MKPSRALQLHRGELRRLVARHGVSEPRVFGSVLAGLDGPDSDVDLLVSPGERTTLLSLAALQEAAEQLLGVPVDVLTPGALPARIREQVLRTARPL